MDTNPQDELLSERQKWEREHTSVPQKPQYAAPPKREPPPAPSVPRLKTFQNDVATSIRSKQETLVSIALAKKAQEHASEGLIISKDEPTSKKPLLIGIVLVLCIGGGVFFAMSTGRLTFGSGAVSNIPSFPTATSTPNSSSPQIPDKNKTVIDISDKNAALATLQASFSETTPPAEVREIIITASGARVLAPDFFSLWATHAPAALTRVLSGEFSAGVYRLTSDTPYIEFSVSNDDRAIAAMLAWEPSLASDFFSLVGGTTPQSTAFTDELVGGVSVRKTQGLLYTFPIKGRVIITTDEEALAKIRATFGL